MELPPEVRQKSCTFLSNSLRSCCAPERHDTSLSDSSTWPQPGKNFIIDKITVITDKTRLTIKTKLTAKITFISDKVRNSTDKIYQ